MAVANIPLPTFAEIGAITASAASTFDYLWQNERIIEIPEVCPRCLPVSKMFTLLSMKRFICLYAVEAE